jgi:hypothetical protein
MKSFVRKSGSLLALISGGPPLSVVGYDGVGSIICERLDGAKKLRLYLSPSLVIEASPKSDPTSSRLCADKAAAGAKIRAEGGLQAIRVTKERQFIRTRSDEPPRPA